MWKPRNNGWRMAHTLKNEQSLRRAQEQLEKEARVLSRLRVIEWPLAVALLAAGLGVYFWKGTAGLLFAGGLAAFLAAGHYFKIKENRVEAGKIGRGRQGEENVAQLLEQTLNDQTFILNDVEMEAGKQKAQVDHLVIGPSGLFVVETKNWPGRLKGCEKDPNWTHFFQGGKSRKVKNPLRQNRRQTDVLHAVLTAAGIRWPDLQPMVVFYSEHTTLEIEGSTSRIFTPRKAAEYIARFQAERTYSEEEVQQVIHLLNP